jgi:DNA-binding CsgD family transcriptional regulator
VLTASDPRKQESLRHVTNAPDLDAKSLMLESREGPLTIATVLPLTSGLRATHAKQLSAIAAIFVHNQLPFDNTLVTALAAAFGLTGAEARVLAALLEGLSVSDTAARHQISVNTVRWHLKRLFEKTGTNRQSELIRLASNAVPQIRPPAVDRTRGLLN